MRINETSTIGRQIIVQLNENCNLNCTYCMAYKANNHLMTDENLEEVKRFIIKNRINFVKITGGEPTLHPRFNQFVKWLVDNDIECLVFSNLTIDLNLMSATYEGKCRFLVNTSEKEILSEQQSKIRYKNIEKLNNLNVRLDLSCTLFDDSYIENLKYTINLFDLCNAKIVRISVANPMHNGKNIYVHPKKYNEIVKNVVEFVRKVPNIKFVWDCTMPKCLVEKEYYNIFCDLMEVSSVCLPRLNINYDLTLNHCYVTENDLFSKSLNEFENFESVCEYLDQAYRNMNEHYKFFEECNVCEYRDRCNPCYGLRSIVNGRSVNAFV